MAKKAKKGDKNLTALKLQLQALADDGFDLEGIKGVTVEDGEVHVSAQQLNHHWFDHAAITTARLSKLFKRCGNLAAKVKNMA